MAQQGTKKQPSEGSGADEASQEPTSQLELSWYRDDSMSLEVRPGPLERSWMNETKDRFAYQCLPLNIANTHCWEILNPVSFYAIWHGGEAQSQIVIYYEDADGVPLAHSLSGHGLMTFPVEGLLRTEPGYDLWVSGPINRPKPHIQALSGIVESDWWLQGFTVSWQFTTPNELVHFEKGEPFCSFFPIQRGLIEKFDPRMRPPEHDEEVWKGHRALKQGRADWNVETQIPGSVANRQAWQRIYLRGPDKTIKPPHRMKLRLKPFKE